MNRWIIVALSMAAATLPAWGQDPVPYAYRPSTGDTYVPDLGDIMMNKQLRHIKLWFAGEAGNWDLANYEVVQILGTLNEAARLYRNLPIEAIVTADEPLVELKKAIGEKSTEHFKQAFTKLTAACNACHQAADLGFIRIQTPGTSPFGDQSFVPK